MERRRKIRQPKGVIARKIERVRNGMPLRVLDLFSGCGGISLGFQGAGYQIEASVELDDFAAGLPNRKMPLMETKLFPVWHRPTVLLLALLCLCGEWGLRRWKGLA